MPLDTGVDQETGRDVDVLDKTSRQHAGIGHQCVALVIGNGEGATVQLLKDQFGSGKVQIPIHHQSVARVVRCIDSEDQPGSCVRANESVRLGCSSSIRGEDFSIRANQGIDGAVRRILAEGDVSVHGQRPDHFRSYRILSGKKIGEDLGVEWRIKDAGSAKGGGVDFKGAIPFPLATDADTASIGLTIDVQGVIHVFANAAGVSIKATNDDGSCIS